MRRDENMAVIPFKKKDEYTTADTLSGELTVVTRYPKIGIPLNRAFSEVEYKARAQLLRLVIGIPDTVVMSFDDIRFEDNDAGVQSKVSIPFAFIYPDDVTFDDINAGKVRISTGDNTTNPNLVLIKAIMPYEEIEAIHSEAMANAPVNIMDTDGDN
jgi:hypothetical protein